MVAGWDNKTRSVAKPGSYTLCVCSMIWLAIAHTAGVGLMGFDVVCVVGALVTTGVNNALTNTDVVVVVEHDEHKREHE